MNRVLIILILLVFNNSIFSQSLEKEDWVKDIDFYKTNLELKHIDLYNKISKTEFEREIQRIKSTLREKTDTEIIIDLMRLTRKIEDGHTALSLRGVETHLYPFELYKVNEKWRVIKVTKKYKSLLGKVLTKIDGKNIDEIAHEIAKVAQYVENKQSEVIRTGEYLTMAELLFGLHFTKNEFKATFTFQGNLSESSDISLDAISKQAYNESKNHQTFQVKTPEINKPNNSKHDFLWFSPIESTQGVYIKFESYPSFEDMEVFGEKVLNYINENSINQIVIDLRNNGGGDFFVGIFLAYYLNLADSVDWKSGVYVLIDKVTFSAATSNASQFRQILNAKIVGEPTGSNPTGYQDMGQFTLPNSGLTITYSKRLFRFQDQITQGIQPDVLIEYDWNSYSNGIDNMMEWIIKDIRKEK